MSELNLFKEKMDVLWLVLRAKLTMQILSVVLIPLFVVGAVVYISFNNSLQKFSLAIDDTEKRMEASVVGENLSKEATDTVNILNTYVSERINDVQIWASNPLIIDAAIEGSKLATKANLHKLSEEALEKRMASTRKLNVNPVATKYLKHQMEKSGVFREIFFTENRGFNVAITNMTSDFLQKGEGWWDTAWEKGRHIGKVEYDESAGVYSVAISIRIDDLDTKKPLGVMKAILDVSAIQRVANETVKGFKDANVVIFDSAGRILADTASNHNKEIVMTDKGKELYKNLTAAKNVNKEGYTRERININGKDVDAIIGYSHIEDGKGSGSNWRAVIAQKRETALEPINKLGALHDQLNRLKVYTGGIFIGILLLSALAGLIIALTFSRGIVQPVLHLTEAANRISMGDMDIKISVDSTGEVGKLAESLERMRESLKAAILRLRSRQASS
ncbi:MAG: HAMP domain-containing protein [Nitrospirae bacterium]|nr:HAMP domain-containing protein [Nitrospirota bacterium]